MKNTLTAFRIPEPMLDDLKLYCVENDFTLSQVMRKSVSNTLYGDKNRLPPNQIVPKPQVVANGWAHHRR